jgi:hypothetical protein
MKGERRQIPSSNEIGESGLLIPSVVQIVNAVDSAAFA